MRIVNDKSDIIPIILGMLVIGTGFFCFSRPAEDMIALKKLLIFSFLAKGFWNISFYSKLKKKKEIKSYSSLILGIASIIISLLIFSGFTPIKTNERYLVSIFLAADSLIFLLNTIYLDGIFKGLCIILSLVVVLTAVLLIFNPLPYSILANVILAFSFVVGGLASVIVSFMI